MSLRNNPDFLKLWAGQAISELGSTVTRDALPLLAVLTLGSSPFEMGVLSALGGLPVIVFGIFAGVWVDRLRRRPLMMIADLGRAFLLGVIPLSAALGFLRIELVYGIVILAIMSGVFFNTAYRAYLPSLTDRTHLVEGNSKLALSSSLAEGMVRRFGLGATLTSMLALISVSALLLPLAVSFKGWGFFFLAIAQLFGDAMRTIYSIHAVSLRQALTPDRLLGRVNASMDLVSEGLAPLGALAGGALATLFGVQTALFVAALHGILASLWIAASPVRRMRVIPVSADLQN